jgi:hypothetical protein
MVPIKFREQTGVLLKPEDMTDEECAPLPIHHDGEWYVSCWRLSFKEKIKALLYGRIWLYVRGKVSQPPVSLSCERTVFEDKNG